MKKIILLFMMTLLTLVAWADDSGTCGENLTWVYEKATGTLTISGTGEMITFGNSNKPWDEYKNEIKTLIIEEGVTSISDYSFSYYEKLTSAQLPESLREIGERAFERSGITTLTLPNSITKIKKAAFTGCINLKMINIPNNLSSLSEALFWGCTELTDIDIPNNITSIGNNVFTQCSGLTTITLHEGITEIMSGAFSSCTGLTSMVIPNSVMEFGEGVFASCI